MNGARADQVVRAELERQFPLLAAFADPARLDDLDALGGGATPSAAAVVAEAAARIVARARGVPEGSALRAIVGEAAEASAPRAFLLQLLSHRRYHARRRCYPTRRSTKKHNDAKVRLVSMS